MLGTGRKGLINTGAWRSKPHNKWQCLLLSQAGRGSGDASFAAIKPFSGLKGKAAAACPLCGWGCAKVARLRAEPGWETQPDLLLGAGRRCHLIGQYLQHLAADEKSTLMSEDMHKRLTKCRGKMETR